MKVKLKKGDSPEKLLPLLIRARRCMEETLCSGITTSNGGVCKLDATKFLGSTGHCRKHPFGDKTEEATSAPPYFVAAESRYWAAVERRIIGIYEGLEMFRRVPPPMELAPAFLWIAQRGVCFMCWAMGLETYRSPELKLVPDHCHETGMVRALLCGRCNARERGKRDKRAWDCYRRYSPATGWFYLFTREGKPFWDGDPLKNRFTQEEVGMTDSFCRRNPKKALAIYRGFAEKQLSTYVPKLRSYCIERRRVFWGRRPPVHGA